MTIFIKQILASEKEAEDRVANAKRDRTLRMKNAKDKADKEVQQYKAQQEQKFKEEMGAKQVADPVAELKGATEREVKAVKDDVAKNQDRTIDFIVKKVLDVPTTLSETQKQAL